jgi:hypothetical protein
VKKTSKTTTKKAPAKKKTSKKAIAKKATPAAKATTAAKAAAKAPSKSAKAAPKANGPETEAQREKRLAAARERVRAWRAAGKEAALKEARKAESEKDPVAVKRALTAKKTKDGGALVLKEEKAALRMAPRVRQLDLFGGTDHETRLGAALADLERYGTQLAVADLVDSIEAIELLAEQQALSADAAEMVRILGRVLRATAVRR